MINIIKKNWTLFFFLGLVSVIYGLPSMLIPRMLDNHPYTPFGNSDGMGSMITEEEVYTYVPEVQEILEGKRTIRDVQLAEYKSSPSPFLGETFPAYLMAGISKITKTNGSAFTLSDFIFPPIIMYLAYILGKKIGLSHALALVVASSIVLSEYLVELIPYPQSMWDLLVHLKGMDDFLTYSRNFHPQLSFPILLVALLLLLRALERCSAFNLFIAGLAIGTQFYTYVFNWTTLAVLLGLLFLKYVLSRRWDLLLALTFIVGVASIVASPYFVSVYQFRSSSQASDLWLSSTTPHRMKLYISLRYGLIAIAVLAVSRRRSLVLQILVLTVISASLLPQLSYIVSGRDLEGMHWIRRVAIPLSVLLVGALVHEISHIFNKTPFLKIILKFMIFIAFGAIVQFSLRVQLSITQRYFMSYQLDFQKEELFRWIREQTVSNVSIATLDSIIQAEIPAYTFANNVIPVRIRSIATTNEATDRFLRVAAIYCVSPKNVNKLIVENGFASRLFFFQADYQGKYFTLSPEQLRDIRLRYQNMSDKQDIIRHFPYALDYLVVGQEEDLVCPYIEESSIFELVFQNSKYKLYRVLKIS